MKTILFAFLFIILLSSCASLPRRKDDIKALDKNSYKKFNGTYTYGTGALNDASGVGNQSLEEIIYWNSDSLKRCKNCYVRIEALSSHKIILNLLAADKKLVHRTVLRGRMSRGGFINKRFHIINKWVAINFLICDKSRLYITPKGALTVDNSSFGFLGIIAIPLVPGGRESTYWKYERVE